MTSGQIIGALFIPGVVGLIFLGSWIAARIQYERNLQAPWQGQYRIEKLTRQDGTVYYAGKVRKLDLNGELPIRYWGNVPGATGTYEEVLAKVEAAYGRRVRKSEVITPERSNSF